jgi:hypothetical protein
VSDIDGEWLDIWLAVTRANLVTWQDWIYGGRWEETNA